MENEVTMGKLSSLIRAAGGKKRFNSAIILAAGNGTRMNNDRAKQFIEIRGLPIMVRSAMAFEQSPEIHEIVVVTRAADIEGCTKILRDHGITKLTKVIAGGSTRQESAKMGFDAVNPACDFVAIHDAARCLITPENIEAVMETAYVSGSAACASRVVDTIKKTNGADTITETIDRENTWLVQTPQVFMADMYRAAAYMAVRDHVTATDDCMLCERLGFQVKLVDTGRFNIKVTYPEDVMMAEMILDIREKNKEGNYTV